MLHSMRIESGVALQSYNTFGLAASAMHFAACTNVTDLREAVRYGAEKSWPLFILGGGSNILLTGDVGGLTIHVALPGKEVVDRKGTDVLVRFQAGELWHDCVMWSIANGWGGMENLSLIPGRMGAAPMQNIGAYGVELKDIFHSLEALDRKTGAMVTFTAADCRFGYRESIFKHEARDQFIITAVTLRLSTEPDLHLEYGAIRDTLQDMGITKPTTRDVSNAVIAIRQSKLPDPARLGNAGSFFKNPEISTEAFQQLVSDFPQVPHYPLPDGQVKIPAAWLIEQCGWKGKVVGHTGAHAQQPLVLVNYGGATGDEIWQLAQDIRQSVADKFSITLQPEVNIV